MMTKEYNEITYLTVNIEGHQKICLELRRILQRKKPHRRTAVVYELKERFL